MKPASSPTFRRALVVGVAAAALAGSVVAANSAQSVFGAPAMVAADANRVLVAQAGAAEPADKPVSYTDEQAARGKKTFVSECVDCHGDDLRGGMNGGPPLRGRSFEQKFADGAPASAMFVFMSTLMPPNDPGRFSPGQYAEMMAYILQKNGIQSGAPLPSDTDKLDNLILQK